MEKAFDKEMINMLKIMNDVNSKVNAGVSIGISSEESLTVATETLQELGMLKNHQNVWMEPAPFSAIRRETLTMAKAGYNVLQRFCYDDFEFQDADDNPYSDKYYVIPLNVRGKGENALGSDEEKEIMYKQIKG